MLLSTAYFPPVSWFAAAARDFGVTMVSPQNSLMGEAVPEIRRACVSLEACEHYQKQSWRNRCMILTATGPEPLAAPVCHNPDPFRTRIDEIRLDYSTPWMLRHQRAIDTAYRSSPYFDYYRDEIFALMNNRPERLWDLNLSIIKYLCEQAGLAIDFVPTAEFTAPGEAPDDFRYRIHPKRPDSTMSDLNVSKPYYQGFGHGFTPGLSMMDLLFNEGPDSIMFLRSCLNLL